MKAEEILRGILEKKSFVPPPGMSPGLMNQLNPEAQALAMGQGMPPMPPGQGMQDPAAAMLGGGMPPMDPSMGMMPPMPGMMPPMPGMPPMDPSMGVPPQGELTTEPADPKMEKMEKEFEDIKSSVDKVNDKLDMLIMKQGGRKNNQISEAISLLRSE